ncbi:hypothetical protein [Allorhizocola rhizosphaerae]|uniref:hypothetical protein n=1 Tax=Allorhizocola rhizosphaerae TaxID=1872709 RepID=UPI0013C36061|nr:hypothetical protein [Allorhizocola rhizosphaerae]
MRQAVQYGWPVAATFPALYAKRWARIVPFKFLMEAGAMLLKKSSGSRALLNKLGTMIAAAIGMLVLVPATAYAAETPLGGEVRTDCSSCWTNYTVNRTATGIPIEFSPSNLLYQGGPASALNLRLNNLSNSAITGSVIWTSTDWWKTIHSNPANGLQFRVAACCYSSSGGDATWAGTLRY